MTTKILQGIKELCQVGGMTDAQMGSTLGITASTVRYWRIKLGLPPGGISQRGNHGPRPGRSYEVYDKKTGALMAKGNSVECSKAMFMTLKSFYSAVWKSKNNVPCPYKILSFSGSKLFGHNKSKKK